jgi:thioredoxin-related protein
VAQTHVPWLSFDAALADAQGRKKYTFVSVYTDWCGYCKKLDRNTLRDEAVVKELTQNFASVKLNAESKKKITWKGQSLSETALAEQWGVSGFPTLIFLNSAGEVIGSFASYAEADMMINLLQYISSGAREKQVPFDEFVRNQGAGGRS